MSKINIDNVLIGHNITDDIIKFVGSRDFTKVVIFTQESICQSQGDFIDKLRNHLNAEIFIIEDSDNSKDISSAINSVSQLVGINADRDTLLIAYGGGSVSDHVGFIASIFKRGIQYINIPTTLIGMIDASIGGKTALNIGNIKNQVGTFYHPLNVFIDLDQINSMPDTIIQEGLGEMFKYAILAGESLFDNFKEYINRPNKNILCDLIQECCKLKLKIVKADERDSNIRKTLNLGHTFGHAIESDSDNNISHGVAVINGLLMESFLSFKKKHLSEEWFNQITLLSKKMLNENYKVKDIGRYVDYMMNDKKNKNNKIAVMIIEDIGKVELKYFDYDEICSVVEDYNEYIGC